MLYYCKNCRLVFAMDSVSPFECEHCGFREFGIIWSDSL
jgi:DNA-directed RNA polymerase subunit RPC12/RpoP